MSNVCDRSACDTCFQNSNCHVIDNPCNDDPLCDPKENKWSGCVCVANGDGTASAKCDSDFAAVNATEAQPIIDCVKQTCPVCYQKGPTTKPDTVGCAVAHDDCSACVSYNCADSISACDKDPACKAAQSALGPCLCKAQLGMGTIADCTAAFLTAGGAAAMAQSTCAGTVCKTACGL
jgi:hypothetical protein